MEQPNSTVRRCAIYTRKSSEEGLEQNFNSLHAQREACESLLNLKISEMVFDEVALRVLDGHAVSSYTICSHGLTRMARIRKRTHQTKLFRSVVFFYLIRVIPRESAAEEETTYS